MPNPKSPRFSPIFSARNFVALHFTFWPAVHFELTFVKGARFMSRLISLHVVVQLLYHHLLKRPSFLHWITFAPLSKEQWLYLCGSISRLCFFPLICFICSFISTTLSWLLDFHFSTLHSLSIIILIFSVHIIMYIYYHCSWWWHQVML